jgi:hypothetical protein
VGGVFIANEMEPVLAVNNLHKHDERGCGNTGATTRVKGMTPVDGRMAGEREKALGIRDDGDDVFFSRGNGAKLDEMVAPCES